MDIENNNGQAGKVVQDILDKSEQHGIYLEINVNDLLTIINEDLDNKDNIKNNE